MEQTQLLLMEQLLLATQNEQQLSHLDVAGRSYDDLVIITRWCIENALHDGHADFFSHIALDGFHAPHLFGLLGWNL